MILDSGNKTMTPKQVLEHVQAGGRSVALLSPMMRDEVKNSVNLLIKEGKLRHVKCWKGEWLELARECPVQLHPGCSC